MHPPVTELVALARGERTSADVVAHLQTCAMCRQLLGIVTAAGYLTSTRRRS